MHITSSPVGITLRESRLLYKQESGFGEHMKDYGRDLKDTYFTDKQGLDRALGAVGAAANVVLRAPDEIYRGIIGQPYIHPHGVAGYTRADIKALIGDIVHLRPLRALGDAWSLVTSDIPLDTINLLTGNTVDGKRAQVREGVSQALAA